MSRGPGRWQRILLAAVESDRRAALLLDHVVEQVLGRPGTRSELSAARRAVKPLAISGKLRAIYLRAERADGWQSAPQLAIAHPHSGAVSDYHAMDTPSSYAVGACGRTARQIWHDNGVPGY